MTKKGYWKMTITPIKAPQNKIIKWLFWNIYWKVWNILRTKMLAWIFGKLADICEKVLLEIDELKPKNNDR